MYLVAYKNDTRIGVPLDFDFANPDYITAFRVRGERLMRIRNGEVDLKALKLYYKDHIPDFISDWGVTFDPRNVGDPVRPAYLPFLLFKRQREMAEWFLERMLRNEDGICEKSRDMGVSWLVVAIAASLCLFNEYMSVGFGSRKEEYVDKLDDPKCLFWKARQFIVNLPREFTGNWSLSDAPHLRITFPNTSSFITGESGDNIGRGDRARVYVVDEAAYLERPKLIDASLSQTTRCRIDVSSANGTANPFFEKRTKYVATPQLFTFNWRDDPRKDQEWYDRECARLDPVVVAQEIDIDYTASVEGILIPNAWVQAAVDAHKKLGMVFDEGTARVGLDVADEGGDKNAYIGGKGSLVRHARQWSGKGIDVVQTTANAAAFCDDYGYGYVTYDADGVGSGIRGSARLVNGERKGNGLKAVAFEPYHGSNKVQHPEREDEYGRQNKDFFQNRKAQAGWRTRKRFERTWQAVTKGIRYEADQLISLDRESLGDLLPQITMQLSQPTFTRNEAGKIIIDKLPDGAKSPDLYDGVVIWSENVGDDTGRAGSLEDALMKIDGNAVAAPEWTELVYGVVHNAGRPGRDNSGTAATLWSLTIDQELYCIGWEYTDAEGVALEQWLRDLYGRLGDASEKARLGSLGLFLSADGENEVVRAKAASFGDAPEIEGRITEMDARGQALHVTNYLGSVRLTAAAVDHSIEFRGAERNHLLFQVRKFSADTKDVEDMAMLRSFVYGVSIGLEQET